MRLCDKGSTPTTASSQCPCPQPGPLPGCISPPPHCPPPTASPALKLVCGLVLRTRRTGDLRGRLGSAWVGVASRRFKRDMKEQGRGNTGAGREKIGLNHDAPKKGLSSCLASRMRTSGANTAPGGPRGPKVPQLSTRCLAGGQHNTRPHDIMLTQY